MHKNENQSDRSLSSPSFGQISFFFRFLILTTVLTSNCKSDSKNLQLPTKIFNIKKSNEEIPIIILSDFSPQFQPISLILDSGSEELALFDNQCQDCINTFSACPHIKTFNNQTLITFLLTKFKGDFSYITLADQLRIRFFCVLEADQNFNSIQTNGILGIKSTWTKINGQNFKQTNGLKIWRKIIHKVYQQELKLIDQKIDQHIKYKYKRLTYSIFYSHYHTQLILGTLPNQFAQTLLTSYSLNQEVYTKQLSFFPKQVSDGKNDKRLNKQIQVHFDTGSSVIVLPSVIFQQLFQNLIQKVSKQCIVVQSMIKCPKTSIEKLIQFDFNFQISLLQDMKQQKNKFQINMENLIENNIEANDKTFSFKIYGNQNQNQNQQQIIILGVPFFKQYLIQFDIPYETNQKITFMDPKKNQIINRNQDQNQQWLKIYGHQIRFKQQLFSPYEHLIKKEAKNIKILLFIYLVLVIIVSYFFLTIYWWVHQFFHGKRSIV